jgi:hypothetical protein
MWNSDRGDIVIPLGIEQSLKAIFSAVMVGSIDKNNPNNSKLLGDKLSIVKVCRARFAANFPFNIFPNNYAVFYEIMMTAQVNTFTSEQLKSIIDNNRDLILNSPYINKRAYTQMNNGNIPSDDDIVNAVVYSLVELLNELSYNYVSEEEYRSSCITYIDWYKNALGEYTALCMSSIMSDIGYDEKKPGGRSRHYQGLQDMTEFYNENIRIIKSLSEENRINSFVMDSKWLTEEMQTENKKDTGALMSVGIKEIDLAYGELRRGNMLGIMGPPKGGKTRFTNYLVQRALSLGLNVCVWPLEGTASEWEAMQVSAFIARTSYEKSKTRNTDDMIRIASKDILQKKYVESKTLRKDVAAAKVVLATSQKFGRLSFIEGTAYVEDMFEVLEAHYENENPYDILVIDQLVNVMSKKGKGKVERISEAYMETKNFLANKLKVPALGIMPAQLKQSVVDVLRSDPEADLDVTSGGESAETVRTPDAVIGLFSSKEERNNNIMKIYSVATRHTESFDNFQSKCYLECCFFASQEATA